MPKSCAVPKCKAYKFKEKCSIFKAPKNIKLFEEWRAVIPNLKLSQFVCEKHFEEQCILRKWIKYDSDNQIICEHLYLHPRLSDNAIPTIFNNNEEEPSDILTSEDIVSSNNSTKCEMFPLTEKIESVSTCKASCSFTENFTKADSIVTVSKNKNIEEIAGSSDNDKEFSPPIPAHFDAIHDADNEMLQLIQLGLRGDYIETVVQNYIEKDFIIHFRLSRLVAYNLIERFAVSEIFTSLQGHAGYAPISAETHVLTYLWFLGHEGAKYRDVADRFGIIISTLYIILTRVTNFLMQLAPNIIKFPTLEEKEQTMTYFLQKEQLPGIIGAVDGTHIRVDKPTQDHESYINKKQYFSMHMQGVVDHKLKFLDVFIGFPGSIHDAKVFQISNLYERLQEICPRDSYILGDSAYPCLEYLIVPYRDNGHLSQTQRHFNSKLNSCRVIIENAFGYLKQRFRQLYHFKLRSIERMVQMIHACCVLHNLANIHDLELLEPPCDDEYPDPEASIININNYDIDKVIPRNERGRFLRDKLCRQLIAQ